MAGCEPQRPTPVSVEGGALPNHAALYHISPTMLTHSTLQNGHAYDAQNREVPLGSDEKRDAVSRATTPLELYRVIGCVG